MNNIHPSALVSRKAKIGENITIDPYLIMEEDSEIGNHYSIGPSTAVKMVKDLNVIGLCARGFSNENIQVLKKTYTYLYNKSLKVSQAKTKIVEELSKNKYVQDLLEFISKSKKGLAGK